VHVIQCTLLCSCIFLVLWNHQLYMYVVYIWKESFAYAVVWQHTLLLLMNSCKQTEAAIFPLQATLPLNLPLFSDYYIKSLVWSVRRQTKCPVLHHCVVIFFWSSGIMECTCMSSAHALRGVSGVASFITTDEQFQ